MQNWLERSSANCLIVDTFPRGLVGELVNSLPLLSIPRFWVHRDLTPDYIASKAVGSFVQRHYTQILVPGETAAPLRDLSSVYYTPPWCIRDLAELKVGATIPSLQAKAL